jgi:hypothetical protein
VPELNANIPPIECFVRGNFLRDQQDSHDKKFPVVIFGVASVQHRSPLFHFLMEDGAIWWRMPISAFCSKPDSPEVDLHELVLWNSFSPYVSVTQFAHMRNMRMTYRDRTGAEISGKYLMTLDWHNADANIFDVGYSENPGQHKCGHVIERDDGNFAIQPNNRCRLFEPSFTTKIGQNLIDRLINSQLWDVEDAAKSVTEDSDAYDYGLSSETPD